MQATARVLDVRDGMARLACDAAGPACPVCRGGRGCALRWLAPSGPAAVAVPDRADDGSRLLPGASVILELREGELLRSITHAYLPPLVGLMAGPLLARSVLAAGEAAVLLAAAAGLAAGWAGARALLRRRPARVSVRLLSEPYGG